MASTQRELEEQLTKAGNSLLEPPSSDDELLPLLDQVENHLSNVEQSPSKSMQTALTPCVKALVTNSLLRHANVDVKVAVASCISEITRITAPDAPYDDDKMKDIFELIVSSFEDLSDKSSRSYSKRTLILETVAKVRSCVVMLDLECDALIVKMFQHFLKSIRDYHPENVFTSMETIMTLVLEESEDISVELISPILSSLKKDNKDFPPIAQKLGERVFVICAKKLKSCLVDAQKSLGLCLDDYSDIVASICNDPVRENNGETCEEQEVEESKPKSSSERVVPDDDDKLVESSLQDTNKEHRAQESVRETSPDGEGPVVDTSGTSIVSNGISESKTELKLDNNIVASQKLDGGDQGDKSSDANVKSNEADDLDSGKIVASEIKAEQTSKKRGRKPKSSTNSAEPSDSSRVDGDKETERLAESATLVEEIHGSPSKDPSHEATLSSENDKQVKLSPAEELENEPVNAASPSPSESVPDESRSKRVKFGRPKKKEKPIQESSPTNVDSEKASKEAIDSEVKPPKRSGKKVVPTGKTSQEKTSALVDTPKSKGVSTSDSQGKLPEQSGKKIAKKDNTASEPSSKKEDKKKRGRGKAGSEKPTESSAKDVDKETLSSPRPDSKDEDVMEETPKVTSKRKRGQGKDNDKETPKPLSKLSKEEDHLEETPKTSSKSNRNKGKEKASGDLEYGAELVGSKVQVWWPDDETFYEGVIDNYDHATKKHKVAYADGEIEILNLREERWEVIGGDTMSDEEQATGGQSSKSGEPSSEKPKKKKAKMGSQSAKQGKRADEVPSIRSKRGATQKSEADDDKPKDKSEADSGLKSKDRANKKSGGKSGVDSSTPKTTSTKSKEGPAAKTATKEAPDAATKSKGKSPKSGVKTDTNGSNKEKSAPGKPKAAAEGSKKTPDKAKTPASGKKSPEDSVPKSQQSETKSGKKRGRGSRH